MSDIPVKDYPLLAYKHNKLAALDGILTAWADASAKLGRGQF